MSAKVWIAKYNETFTSGINFSFSVSYMEMATAWVSATTETTRGMVFMQAKQHLDSGDKYVTGT